VSGADRVSACPACGSDRVVPGPIDGSVLVACARCGLVWRGVPGDSALLDHYREGYFGDEGGYGQYFERAAQWRFEARRRVEWLLRHARPATLLEVGCGGGFFLEAARARGIAAEGIEPSLEAGRYAREELHVPVATGLFEDVATEGAFDALCAFHVLEHVREPSRFLADAADRLVPGGTLALEVPNIASAGAEREGERWPNFQPRYHLWHFSPATLAEHARRAGLDVVALDTIFPRFYARLLRDPQAALATIRDLRVGRTLRSSASERGDFVRLIARKPA
jgi:2-polyprenyl-3-methyl-5-hydroxy-6-metoxy-1,4-benzoquinol methylase